MTSSSLRGQSEVNVLSIKVDVKYIYIYIYTHIIQYPTWSMGLDLLSFSPNNCFGYDNVYKSPQHHQNSIHICHSSSRSCFKQCNILNVYRLNREDSKLRLCQCIKIMSYVLWLFGTMPGKCTAETVWCVFTFLYSPQGVLTLCRWAGARKT